MCVLCAVDITRLSSKTCNFLRYCSNLRWQIIIFLVNHRPGSNTPPPSRTCFILHVSQFLSFVFSMKCELEQILRIFVTTGKPCISVCDSCAVLWCDENAKNGLLRTTSEIFWRTKRPQNTKPTTRHNSSTHVSFRIFLLYKCWCFDWVWTDSRFELIICHQPYLITNHNKHTHTLPFTWKFNKSWSELYQDQNDLKQKLCL